MISKRTWTWQYLWRILQSSHAFVEKGSKDLKTRGFQNGIKYCGYVVQGRNIKQAARSRLKSTGQNVLQKAMDTVEPPGQRAMKGPAKRKKDQMSADQATEHIE